MSFLWSTVLRFCTVVVTIIHDFYVQTKNPYCDKIRERIFVNMERLDVYRNMVKVQSLIPYISRLPRIWEMQIRMQVHIEVLPKYVWIDCKSAA